MRQAGQTAGQMTKGLWHSPAEGLRALVSPAMRRPLHSAPVPSNARTLISQNLVTCLLTLPESRSLHDSTRDSGKQVLLNINIIYQRHFFEADARYTCAHRVTYLSELNHRNWISHTHFSNISDPPKESVVL